MGKNNRHQKNLKSERSKVKLKTKKSKVLPKGQNITNTAFRVKKIVLQEQLREHDEDNEIVSRRKLNIKEILSRLQHHNSTVRLDAIKELKQILQRHSIKSLSSYLNVLLQGLSALILDKESGIRKDGLKVLSLILGPISKEELAPFSNILIIYLCCAMSHIAPSIKEDSLNFLDVLIQNCSDIIANNSTKILSNFLDMISKLHSQSQINRHLTLSINSKNTTLKWRTKVFQRLSNIFNSIIHSNKLNHYNNISSTSGRELIVDDKLFHLTIINPNNLNICRLDYNHQSGKSNDILNDQEFSKYIDILMPLIFDSWLEVSPKIDNSKQEIPIISVDAADLLKSVTSVIQLVIEIVDLIDVKDNSINQKFKSNFIKNFSKYFVSNFPYSQTITMVKMKRNRQDDYNDSSSQQLDNCIEQNLNISFIYLWMIAVESKNEHFSNEMSENCQKVIDYLNDKVNNWNSNDPALLSKLIKTLRILFLKGSKILYRNNVNLGSILKSTIVSSSKGHRYELQTQLFSVIGDVILNRELKEIHCEPAFISFLKTLPNLLLQNSIHDSTIRILNRVVLQFKDCICDELAKKEAEILENAHKIVIIGSNDEKRSRLMVFNLLYFINEEVFY